jgi:hypothetical protein
MDITTQSILEGTGPARGPAAGALCALVVLVQVASPAAFAGQAERQAAVLLHTRITGVPPSPANLNTMEQDLVQGNKEAAAAIPIAQPQFYNNTLKNIFLPATNRDQSVFVPLSDYVVTAIGMIHDDVPFNTALSADILYTLNASGLPAPSASNNNHYATADANDVDISASLVKTTQTAVYGYPSGAPAGLMTTRGSASAFFVNGTNRAMFRFTLINHLCRDMETVQDATRPSDRIRRDVSTSPGGDSRVYLNTCVSCHSGMDPMAQAFAYYNFDNTALQMVYTAGSVQHKYAINTTNNPYGFVTPDNSWSNRWRSGPNSLVLGFDPTLPGSGTGAASLGQELAQSQAFAQCQVQKAFQAMCLRLPSSQADTTEVNTLTQAFQANGYKLKQVFADAALYCTVP